MTVVVDASVAVQWFVDEGGPSARAARRLLLAGHDLIAPSLLLAEVQNVMWKKLRAGQVTEEQGSLVAASLARFFAHVEPEDALVESAWALAVAHDHPVYDCIYVALAQSAGARLATFDKRMKLLARAAGVPLETM
ncbi:MAG: type II toxin-antitoxin system VapC family toxin [Proteobacteria bacterium]|jgi:predicted nucleic acid-binding protein|nr:type II toxin-antitoxin system VapC family toxin [Pseudomonadota bacterium]